MCDDTPSTNPQHILVSDCHPPNRKSSATEQRPSKRIRMTTVVPPSPVHHAAGIPPCVSTRNQRQGKGGVHGKKPLPNEHRLIDIHALFQNQSTHMTCRRCAVDYKNGVLDKLPVVECVVLGDYGLASCLDIHCSQCGTVENVHPPTVATGREPLRHDHWNKYLLNNLAVLLMQHLGLGGDGIDAIGCFLGIPCGMNWGKMMFHRLEDSLREMLFDITDEIIASALVSEVESTLEKDEVQLQSTGCNSVHEWKQLSDGDKKAHTIKLGVKYDMGWQKRGFNSTIRTRVSDWTVYKSDH